MGFDIKKYWPVIVVLLIAFFIRIYNFNDRAVYGPEQAMSLSVSANYINEKISLLGQPYFRESSDSHTLFSGAIFNYSLVPLQLLANYNPIIITYWFLFLNLFTGFIFFLYAKNRFSLRISIYSIILFLLNAYMVYHSFFIWNYNYLPLVLILQLILITKYKKHKYLHFLIGLLSGIGFSLQYLYLLPATIILIFLIYNSRNKLLTLLLYASGVLVGNLPMVVFDLRHDFYHLKTLAAYAISRNDSASGEFGFRYYHFLYLWPVFALIGGILISKIHSYSRLAALFILSGYLYYNFNSEMVRFDKAVGMPESLTAAKILIASGKIADDAEGNFNISETYDFDSRAYVLRYPIRYMYEKEPQGIDNYRNIESLYVLSELGYDYGNPFSWELKEFMPYSQSLFYKIDEKWGVFKLTKK